MALSPKSTTKEAIKTAITVAAGLFLLGMFIVLLGGNRFWEEYDVYRIRFDSVKDLTVNRDVKYAGLNIGRVRDIYVDPDNPAKIDVVIGVTDGFPLYKGVVARIAQKGLVGDNYIALKMEGEAGPPLEPGAWIPAVSSATIQDLAEQGSQLLVSLGPRLEGVAAGLERILSTENTAKISAALEGVPPLIEKLDTVLAKVDRDWSELAASLKTGADSTTAAVIQTAERLERTLNQVDAALAEAEKALAEYGALAADARPRVNRALDSVAVLGENLDSDLEYDQQRLAELMYELERLSTDLRGLASGLKERPWQVLRPAEGEELP